LAVSATAFNCLGEPSGPTAIILSNITRVPGLILFNADFMLELNVPPFVESTIASARGLAIIILNLVTLNLASKSKLSNVANKAFCALSATVAIVPPVFPANLAIGSGIRFTLNSVVLNVWVLPGATSADTDIRAVPGELTVTLYFPPDPAIRPPPPFILTLILFVGVPGAETEIGLLTPI